MEKPELSATGTTVMMLCPHLKCRKILRVPASCRGKQVKCQHCGSTFRVPLQSTSSDPVK